MRNILNFFGDHPAVQSVAGILLAVLFFVTLGLAVRWFNQPITVIYDKDGPPMNRALGY